MLEAATRSKVGLKEIGADQGQAAPGMRGIIDSSPTAAVSGGAPMKLGELSLRSFTPGDVHQAISGQFPAERQAASPADPPPPGFRMNERLLLSNDTHDALNSSGNQREERPDFSFLTPIFNRTTEYYAQVGASSASIPARAEVFSIGDVHGGKTASGTGQRQAVSSADIPHGFGMNQRILLPHSVLLQEHAKTGASSVPAPARAETFTIGDFHHTLSGPDTGQQQAVSSTDMPPGFGKNERLILPTRTLDALHASEQAEVKEQKPSLLSAVLEQATAHYVEKNEEYPDYKISREKAVDHVLRSMQVGEPRTATEAGKPYIGIVPPGIDPESLFYTLVKESGLPRRAKNRPSLHEVFDALDTAMDEERDSDETYYRASIGIVLKMWEAQDQINAQKTADKNEAAKLHDWITVGGEKARQEQVRETGKDLPRDSKGKIIPHKSPF